MDVSVQGGAKTVEKGDGADTQEWSWRGWPHDTDASRNNQRFHQAQRTNQCREPR